jgi:hypothetical protein
MKTSMADSRRIQTWLTLAALLAVHSYLYCVSLVYLAPYHVFHLFYDERLWLNATLVVTAFSALSLLFVFSNFSFGYFAGFYFYSMILGYLWLGTFSDLNYNHSQAAISAAASAAAFMLPALLVSAPLRPFTMSERAFERLLALILVLSVVTIASGAAYNFKMVGIGEIYNYRDELKIPTLLKYAIGMTSNALLPFAFACFLARDAWWRAGATLVLLLLFYPITLSKLAFFAPIWLVVMAVLSRLSGARMAAILSLSLPLAAGVALLVFFPAHAYPFSHLFNLRAVAVPSIAMDIYNDFFAHHDITYFCQISFAKSLFPCPYREPLSIVMEKTYGLGNFNASLFATEGVASVGPWLAPFSALICGLIIAIGNRASAGLPPRLVLISSCIVVQTLLNVPLTTALLTYGAGALFLLWYITPRPPARPAES